MTLNKKRDKISLSSLMGKGVQIKESKKSLAKKDKIFFVNLLGALEEIDLRTEELLEYGINAVQYEDPYHQIIEGLIYKCYGAFKADLIFWWLGEKIRNKGKQITLNSNTGEEYVINTASQLYITLMKIDK